MYSDKTTHDVHRASGTKVHRILMLLRYDIDLDSRFRAMGITRIIY